MYQNKIISCYACSGLQRLFINQFSLIKIFNMNFLVENLLRRICEHYLNDRVAR